jgi:glycine cleavage system H protein
MGEVRYSDQHEWIRVEGEIGTVGISDFAQSQLGDVVFVDLPEVGKVIGQGEEAAVVESVKAASEIYSPVGGEVIEINEALVAEPGTVNDAAEGEGWFFKLKLADPSELDDLMDDDDYASYAKQED